MPPKGLAILLGAGPATGAGIARILAHPDHGNMAVALLARRPDALAELKAALKGSSPAAAVFEAFPTDTSPDNLAAAFEAIRTHPSFAGLKLRLAVYNIKHSSKKPFLQETHAGFTDSLQTYAGGAFQFAQLALRRFFDDHGSATLAESSSSSGGGDGKKGTLIFTGTLGALRCNAEFAAYGAGRASVRQLAQALAREMSAKGVQVVHAIANGRIEDSDGEAVRGGRSIAAEAVGKTYLWLSEQEPTLWTHELDMRPAQEKF